MHGIAKTISDRRLPTPEASKPLQSSLRVVKDCLSMKVIPTPKKTLERRSAVQRSGSFRVTNKNIRIANILLNKQACIYFDAQIASFVKIFARYQEALHQQRWVKCRRLLDGLRKWV